MDGAALALTAARGVHLAASLSALGIVVFELAVAPTILRRVEPEIRDEIDGRLVLLWRLSLVVAIAGGLAWLAAETIAVVDDASLPAILDSLWPMLTDTRFGRVLGCRLALLLLAALLLRRRRQGGPLVAAGLATAVAVMLHVAASHAAAMETGRWLAVVVEALHLLAAGIWLGSLLPLLIVVDRLPPSLAQACLQRFSPLAGTCVGILAVTAVVQGWILIGGLGGLLGTDYGLIALLKIALLLAMLALAGANRFRLTPALARDVPGRSRAWLRRCIGLEALIGLAVVLAAAALADLAPAVHEQPTWPFATRPSLVALGDPDLRQEVVTALLLIAAALLLAVVGFAWRRLRWVALAAAFAVAVVAARRADVLEVLLVEAYPTSFYQSPTGFSAAAIAAGAALFPANCAQCHGAEGRGDGPGAKSLPIPPADLTAAHLWEHSDGELFWWLTHGMDNPEGGLAMPGFADSLSDDDRWALIDYVRAHNAGEAMAAAGQWPHPVAAPLFSVRCAGGQPIGLADLRGRMVRLIAADRDVATAADAPGAAAAPLATVLLARGEGLHTPADACIATDPAAWEAYAIVGGVPPDALAQTQFLVDPQGWLRSLHRSDDPTQHDPAALRSEIERIYREPLATSPGASHVHAH